MKIRLKYTLLQSSIIVGFLASMFFVVIQFSRADNLKRLELRCVESLTELKTLENKTLLFSRRDMSLERLWKDWLATYKRFDFYYTDLLTSPHHVLLGKEAVTRKDARKEAWNNIKAEEISPLIADFEIIMAENQSLKEFIGNRSLEVTRRVAIESGITNESPDLAALEELELRFSNLRESLISRISLPTEAFAGDISTRVDRFSGVLFFTAMGIAVIIQAAGTLPALRFSRRFSQNIVLLERTMAQVADGNFNIDLEIRSSDEFEDISKHFNLLTTDLWVRLDSMKDMMRDIGGSTGEGTSIDELREFMLELAIDNTGADAGLLFAVDEDMLVLEKSLGYFPPPMALPIMVASKQEYVVEWFSTHRIPRGEGLLGQVFDGSIPRFIRDNTSRELPDNADRESHLYINSAIFVPLRVSGKSLGILALALTRKEAQFTDLDYAYMQSYGEFISLTLDNMAKYNELVKSHQINREIEVAAEIQKTLLPEKMPKLSGAQAGAFSDAAKGVSGDYYDVFPLGDDKTAMVICDVAGKGVPASLLMIMIRTIIRSISAPDKKADRILTEVNKAVTGRLGADRFATISLIILDAQQGIASYSNGAHHPLFVLRGDTGEYRMFDTDGLPLGIDINASFGHKKIQVKPQDYLVMFTDGLPEARNTAGEELGTDRLLRFVARNAPQNPGDMARSVKEYIDDFTSGTSRHDDQTFLVLKVG